MSLDYEFSPANLDEFLVEYVDGTMDPVVREAFEEFLNYYPEVAEQVSCLENIRLELCRLGDNCRCQAPPGFQARLRRHLSDADTLELTNIDMLSPHLRFVAIAFSLALLVLALSSLGDSDSASSTRVVDNAATTVGEVGQGRSFFLNELPGVDQSSVSLLPNLSEVRGARWNASFTHQVSNPLYVSSLDRPVLLSARQEAIAFPPMQIRP